MNIHKRLLISSESYLFYLNPCREILAHTMCKFSQKWFDLICIFQIQQIFSNNFELRRHILRSVHLRTLEVDCVRWPGLIPDHLEADVLPRRLVPVLLAPEDRHQPLPQGLPVCPQDGLATIPQSASLQPTVHKIVAIILKYSSIFKIFYFIKSN